MRATETRSSVSMDKHTKTWLHLFKIWHWGEVVIFNTERKLCERPTYVLLDSLISCFFNTFLSASPLLIFLRYICSDWMQNRMFRDSSRTVGRTVSFQHVVEITLYGIQWIPDPESLVSLKDLTNQIPECFFSCHYLIIWLHIVKVI